MAAAKKSSPEQIVAKLRETERLQGQGATVPQVCKKLGCAEQTFYAGAGERQAQADHRRAGAGHLDAQGPDPPKLLTRARRRDAVADLMKKFKVSERRACKVVGQYRSSNRYAAAAVDFEVKLVARMTALAERHPRWGYRMVHGLLAEEGWAVNKKRIERLWRQEGLQVPP